MKGLPIGTGSLSKSAHLALWGEQAITTGLTPLLGFSRICLSEGFSIDDVWRAASPFGQRDTRKCAVSA